MPRHGSKPLSILCLAALLGGMLATSALAEEPPEPDPSFQVTGTVTDEVTGEPIADTLVMLFQIRPQVQPVTSTTTDQLGRYTLTYSEVPDALGVPDAAAYENEYHYPGFSGLGSHVFDVQLSPRTGDPAVLGQVVNAATGEVLTTGKLDAFLHYDTFVDGTRPFLPFSVGYPGQVDRRPADPGYSFEYYRVQPGEVFEVEAWAPGFRQHGRSEPVVYDGEETVLVTVELEPHFTDVEPAPDPEAASDLEVAISWFGDMGLSTGYGDGSFRPWNEVTRQALVTFLYRLEGSPPVELDDAFVDVSADHDFATEISWASETGLVTGWEDETFRPTRTVTRQAMAAILYRYAEGAVPDDHDDFLDVDTDHPFADAIAWMAGTGITTGFEDDTFRPNAALRRGPTAQFLYRLDQLQMADEEEPDAG